MRERCTQSQDADARLAAKEIIRRHLRIDVHRPRTPLGRHDYERGLFTVGAYWDNQPVWFGSVGPSKPRRVIESLAWLAVEVAQRVLLRANSRGGELCD